MGTKHTFVEPSAMAPFINENLNGLHNLVGIESVSSISSEELVQPSSAETPMKYVVVTGGSFSGLGKGTTISSIGVVLQNCGLKLTAVKVDPYLNLDAGTMSPYEHGEVYVLDDGGEADLDLGNYERFLNLRLTRDHNITTGKIYGEVLQAERRGDFLGKTVQVVPHITDCIEQWIERVARVPVGADGTRPEVCLVEVGGTVGDIESVIFLEALHRFERRVGSENICFCHLSYVPALTPGDQQKTKATQHSVKELLQAGLRPDVIFCRCKERLTDASRRKISQFCFIDENKVVSLHDIGNLFLVPLLLHEQRIGRIICKKLNIPYGDAPARTVGVNSDKPLLKVWRNLIPSLSPHLPVTKIGIVGKYVGLHDSYLSVVKALMHAAIELQVKLEICWIESSHLELQKENSCCSSDGVSNEVELSAHPIGLLQPLAKPTTQLPPSLMAYSTHFPALAKDASPHRLTEQAFTGEENATNHFKPVSKVSSEEETTKTTHTPPETQANSDVHTETTTTIHMEHPPTQAEGGVRTPRSSRSEYISSMNSSVPPQTHKNSSKPSTTHSTTQTHYSESASSPISPTSPSSECNLLLSEVGANQYEEAWAKLKSMDGIVCPGGFGDRGVRGKAASAGYCRRNGLPYLGICLGMQTAVVDFARDLPELNFEADSEEFDEKSPHKVVISMPDYSGNDQMGGSMRLGQRKAIFKRKDSLTYSLYNKEDEIFERHRHRFEVNPAYVSLLERNGLRAIAWDETGIRVGIMEYQPHPYFVCVQFHPEFNSRPFKPSPVFLGLLLASVGKLESRLAAGNGMLKSGNRYVV